MWSLFIIEVASRSRSSGRKELLPLVIFPPFSLSLSAHASTLCIYMNQEIILNGKRNIKIIKGVISSGLEMAGITMWRKCFLGTLLFSYSKRTAAPEYGLVPATHTLLCITMWIHMKTYTRSSSHVRCPHRIATLYHKILSVLPLSKYVANIRAHGFGNLKWATLARVVLFFFRYYLGI